MLAPTGQNRMRCNPHANWGTLLRPLDMPSFRVFAVAVPKPDAMDAEATRPQRLVIAHFGNGASITAPKAGQSIDSSMGLTPSGGVLMGTRSGDLDPGVLVYLMREKNFDAAKLEALVDQHSGLLGISGGSGDMRRLHETAAANPDARLAIEMFCVSLRKQIAAMIAVLGGLGMLVFTGGICENDPDVRDEFCSGLSWIGVSLDDSRNCSASNLVSDGPSRCQVLVLASQEDEQIALHAWALLT
jgi:acetate kinase